MLVHLFGRSFKVIEIHSYFTMPSGRRWACVSIGTSDAFRTNVLLSDVTITAA